MESDNPLAQGEFTPSIRRNVKLDDLSIRDEYSLSKRARIHPHTPMSRKADEGLNGHSEGPRRNSLPGIFLHNRIDRPRLVDVHEFRNSVSAWVDAVTRGRNVQAAESRRAQSTTGGIDRLDASPLVRALRQSISSDGGLRKGSSLPGTPLTPSISTPLENPGFSLESATSEPVKDTVSKRMAPRNDLVLQSSVPESISALRSSLRLPPIPSPSRHTSARVSSASSPTIKQLHPSVTSNQSSSVFSVHDTLKLVRIIQRIAARKILRAWRRCREPKSPIEPKKKKSKATAGEKKIKAIMKDLALSTLTNSRLIREELMGIRQGLSQQPVSKAPIVRGTSVVNFSKPPPMSVCPPFKSCRILIGPAVLSPVMMDRMIDDLTAGRGRNGVRLCIAQPEVNPRAFVLVIVLNTLSMDEWISRISNCFYIFAYDRAFPFCQNSSPGIPWEITVRNDMYQISPEWVETGGTQVTVYNSDG